jgi:hypothetical protein
MIRSIKIDYKEIRRSTEAQSRHHKVYLKVYVFFFVKKKKITCACCILFHKVIWAFIQEIMLFFSSLQVE